MTRDQVVALTLSRLRRPGDTALAASIITELNLWQQIEAEKSAFGQMWFLLRYGELTLSVDRLQAPLPDDFLSFPQLDGCLFLSADDDADPTAMVASTRFDPPQTFTGQFDTASGAGWSQQGSTINFAAALESGSVPVIIYYGAEELNEAAYLAGGQPDPNAWMREAPDLAIAKMVLLFATTYLKFDDAAIQVFDMAVQKAEARLITQNTLQEEGARIRVLNSYYQRSREARGGFTLTV